MKALLFLALILLAIGLVSDTQAAQAQAYGNTAFVTTFVYQNPTQSTLGGIKLIYFFPSSAIRESITIPYRDLSEGQTISVFIGTLDQPVLGFHGTTYVESAQSLATIQIQIAEKPGMVKARPITNLPVYGSPEVWIPTIVRDKKTANTLLTIQNVDEMTNMVHISLYDLKATEVFSTDVILAVNQIYTFDTNLMTGDKLSKQFSGSARLSATQQYIGSRGEITVKALELDSLYLGAKAFEGMPFGKQQVFMPSAACDYIIGPGVLVTSTYAVQNASLSGATDVLVTYSNGITDTKTIQPGAKASFNTCKANGMKHNYSGSAYITSSNAPIVAVGKVFGAGISTAFTGAPGGAGSRTLALPYIRWVNKDNWYDGTRQRTFISIQNVGTEPIQGSLHAYFYPCNNERKDHEIKLKDAVLAPGEKVNLNPHEVGLDTFGYCDESPQVSGSVLIVGPENSHLAAVVRVEQWDPANKIVVGEDYNAIAVP